MTMVSTELAPKKRPVRRFETTIYRSKNYPFVSKPAYPDKGLLRQGQKLPEPKKISSYQPGRWPLANVLRRCGYAVGPNGGSVKVRAEGAI